MIKTGTLEGSRIAGTTSEFLHIRFESISANQRILGPRRARRRVLLRFKQEAALSAELEHFVQPKLTVNLVKIVFSLSLSKKHPPSGTTTIRNLPTSHTLLCKNKL